MSNSLAIAAVTAVLRDLLDNAMIIQDVSNSLQDTVKVSSDPLERIDLSNEDTRLNLLLYHIAPNLGWRNADLPSRDSRGQALTNPPLALDLYYLLTAYGKQDFAAEILLGYGMKVLHDTPVLTRNMIRESLKKKSGVYHIDTGILPPAMKGLEASKLADQVEQIKINLYYITIDEMSKIWTAFQVKYRPSVIYHVSVVLIESDNPVRTPLPVLSPNVKVNTGLIPPYPTIERLESPNKQIAVRLGEKLTFYGHNLGGDAVSARFINTKTREELELPAIDDSNDSMFKVELPKGDDTSAKNWKAGVYSVSEVINEGNNKVQTNSLPIALAPRILSIFNKTVNNSIRLRVKFEPAIPVDKDAGHLEQKVMLFVGDRGYTPDVIKPKDTVINELTFTSTEFPPEPRWKRLRVDDVESILIDRSKNPPEFLKEKWQDKEEPDTT